VIVDLEHELAAALAAPSVVAALEQLIRRVVREELVAAGVGEELLDASSAARLLGTTPTAVSKAAWRGTLPSVRFGRRVRFRRSDLIAPGQQHARRKP
jgi:excisionase family DNA binding protein